MHTLGMTVLIRNITKIWCLWIESHYIEPHQVHHLPWDSAPSTDPVIPVSIWCWHSGALEERYFPRAATSVLLPEGSAVLIVNCIQITQAFMWLIHHACIERPREDLIPLLLLWSPKWCRAWGSGECGSFRDFYKPDSGAKWLWETKLYLPIWESQNTFAC